MTRRPYGWWRSQAGHKQEIDQQRLMFTDIEMHWKKLVCAFVLFSVDAGMTPYDTTSQPKHFWRVREKCFFSVVRATDLQVCAQGPAVVPFLHSAQAFLHVLDPVSKQPKPV